MPVLLAAAAMVTWYLAVRAAADATRDPAAGVLVGGGLPALAGVAWAAAVGLPQAAVALALGVAVASACLVLGLVVSARPANGPVRDDPARVGSAALLPAALAYLLIGFAGRLTLGHAVLLLAGAGVAAWLVRSEAPPMAEESEPRPQSNRLVTVLQLALAAVLSVAGAGFVWAATGRAGRLYGSEVDATFATILAAPLIALPLIGVGVTAAGDGRGPETQRGLILLAASMLTVAVPLAVLITFGRGIYETASSAESLRAGAAAIWADPPSAPAPLRLLRIDAVVLCVVGLLLLPAAAGRWRPGVPEGVGLLALYVAYLILSVVAAR